MQSQFPVLMHIERRVIRYSLTGYTQAVIASFAYIGFFFYVMYIVFPVMRTLAINIAVRMRYFWYRLFQWARLRISKCNRKCGALPFRYNFVALVALIILFKSVKK